MGKLWPVELYNQVEIMSTNILIIFLGQQSKADGLLQALEQGSANTFWRNPKNTCKFLKPTHFVSISFCKKYFTIKYQF